MKIEFFMPMKNPPTITQQEHKVTVVRGKLVSQCSMNRLS